MQVAGLSGEAAETAKRLQAVLDQYADARPALVVTVWTAVLVAIQQPLSTLAIVRSRMWHVANCSLLWAIMNIAMTYALLDHGAVGVAVGRLAAYASYAVLIGYLSLWSTTSLDARLSTSVSVATSAARPTA